MFDDILACVGYCPSVRLQGVLRRFYRVEHIWQLSHDQFRELRDRLTLGEGRTELDRIARALHSTEFLPETLERYPYEFGRLRKLFGGAEFVTVFRAISRDDPHRCIRPGDWVALEKSYARMHGGRAARLLQKRVHVLHVKWAETDENEWIYAPCPAPDLDVYEYLQNFGAMS